MIITRTPLRISIGGGGTDLPSYYGRRGGFLISAAINRYVYIAINDTFTDDYVIKYSALERVERVDDIAHPLVREALRLHPIGRAKEIVSIADIPAGTGLGSSGAFTVGLLRALYAYKREHVTAGALAEEACHIEIEVLQEPVGKQDQYIAALRRALMLRDRCRRPSAGVPAGHHERHAARPGGEPAALLHRVLAQGRRGARRPGQALVGR